ncbi:MAG TPA: HAD-IB family hydrolase [Nocardioidaceae bacterium]|nr:HAD-IB family hydrolase [Nocardioidaceae bacterium]
MTGPVTGPSTGTLAAAHPAADAPGWDEQQGRPAAFFDLDKTIIAKSSTLAFSKPFQAGGLISRRAVLRSAYAQFVYHVGGADHDQMEKMRQFLSALCAGWDVQTVRDIVAETLHNVVDPLVYDEAVSLIEEHHLAGRDVIIVSASGAEVVEPIGELLGADGVVATRMRIVDGRYTGEIDYYAYGVNKAAALQELARQHDYDLAHSYAYSDSVTDVHMLEVVGNPYAVNPDRDLRREALARGWPVLVFTRQVSLRSRVRLPHGRPTRTAMALGTAAALGGAVYAVARRRLTPDSN